MENSVNVGKPLVLAVIQLVRALRDENNRGLSPSSISALRRLSMQGPMRLSDLAEAEAASQPAMTQLISRLDSAGLVARRPAEGDRRGIAVEVTSVGSAALGTRVAEHADMIDAVVASLDAEDRAQLLGALPAFLRLADAASKHARETTNARRG